MNSNKPLAVNERYERYERHEILDVNELNNIMIFTSIIDDEASVILNSENQFNKKSLHSIDP
jgi:hypothetical protein